MKCQKNLRGTLKIFDISESLGQTRLYISFDFRTLQILKKPYV